MPQSEHETAYVMECDRAGGYRAVGRTALGGRTIPEWLAFIGAAGVIDDPTALVALHAELGLPPEECLGGAFDAPGGVLCLAFYEGTDAPAD